MRELCAPIGVVLAGGLSSRMDSDKAMLSIDGRSMLQHQVDLLSPLCSKVLVSGEYTEFDCVPDAVARCGPLGGIYSVATQCADSALLIIPVDMLRITHKQLVRLMQSANACHFSDQPLPAFFPEATNVVAAIQQIFVAPKPDFSLRTLHSTLFSTVFDDVDFAPLNINTAADWHKFVQNKYK
jgi:molybdenum cofactor guanylyltransferase